MDDILRILQKAGRRLSFNTYLHQLHWVAIYGAALACIMAILTKGFPALESALGWAWFAPTLIVAAFLGALGLWTRQRPTTLHVAITVDERLSLREKISTAMLCRGQDDGFAQAAVDDAITVARDPHTQEKVSRLFPIVAPQRWWISPAILSATALITLFAPNINLFAKAEDPLSKEDRQQIQAIQQEVEDTTIDVLEQAGLNPEEIKEFLMEQEGANLDNPDEREEPLTPKEAQQKAFEDLKKVEDKLLREQSEDEQAQALNELANRLNALDLEKQDGPANDLGAALKAGDFAKAKKALQQLQEKLEKGDLNEEQKKALAEQLTQMAKQMDQLAKQNEKLAEALKQAGIDPNLANNPQALKQALENAQNLTPEQKKQLQQIANAQQQAGQMMRNMAGATQQMAQGMGQGMPGMPGMPGQGMGEMLSQMEMTQQKMNSMQAALDSIAGACEGMGQGGGLAGKSGGISQGDAMAQWQAMMQQQMNGGRGPGMRGPGRGAGGRASRQATKGQTTPDRVNVKQGQGPIIGETFIDSDGQIKGDSAARFVQIIQTAKNRNNQDLEENKISVKHQDAVKHYFGELEARAKSTNAEVIVNENNGAEGDSKTESADDDK